LAGLDHRHANRTVIAMAMIETRKALHNLDDILSVPGLDAIYVGPADLALSLGKEPAGDPTDPVVLEAIEAIVAGARKHDIRAGIHTGSPDGAKRMIARGYQFVTIQADNALLAGAARAAVGAMREGAAAGGKPAGPY
ncbi:MAG TPA: aldolase/citrate lyase family protein, partial [Alphaproteobacteria bacterium]|nr:aldolase/citrate lyase family protein [Alphaproteobacteria bacterium]